MASAYDAFSEGIELGGLRSRSEIRLLICYLLKSLDAPVPRALLNDAVLQEGLANYFELNQAVEELLANGNVRSFEQDGEELFSVTETGRDIAELLQTNLTRTVREKAVRAALNLLTVYRREKENRIEIQKTGAGYKIDIGMFATAADKEQGNSFLSLSLFTSDAMQAESIKKGFLKDPVKLCDVIMSTLLGGE
ncbi:MAG: DUF4364 family protein [Oscillospiraceae bacterium]|nr:DUF4364 family protein [Oscillospiraceae bacterium]